MAKSLKMKPWPSNIENCSSVKLRAEHLEDFKRRVIELALEPVVEEPPRDEAPST